MILIISFLQRNKKKQTYKPDSVLTKVNSHHLSRRLVTQTLNLPTLLHWAGTLKRKFTWHCTA